MQNWDVQLCGKRLRLVPYLPHHVPRYHEWMLDPALLAATCSEPLSFDEERENQQSWLRSDDKLTFIMLIAGVDADTGNGMRRYEMVGDCNVFLDQQDVAVAEVEVSVSEASYRRLGVAEEAIRLLMVYVARHIRRFVFEAKILSSNTGSIDLFTKKLGFEFHRELKVFEESHFRRTLADDAAIDALEAECGFRQRRYLRSPEAQPEDGLEHQVAGTRELASEGLNTGYLWSTWEARAAGVAKRGDLLRHAAGAESSIHAGSIIAAGVLLSREAPNDECGSVAAFIGGPQGERVAIAHSGVPNALYVQEHLVAIRTIDPGEAVLINLNASLPHELKYPFPDAPFTQFWLTTQPHSDDRTSRVAAASDGTTPMAAVGRGFAPLSDLYRNRWLCFADAAVRRVAYSSIGFVPASSNPELLTIKHIGAAGFAPIALTKIPQGTVIYDVKGIALPFPTVYTLCIADGVHVLFNCDAQCLAHSCAPNVDIEVPAGVSASAPSFRVVANRDVADGEVIAFDYLTTEWSMNEPFDCSCGASGCRRTIAGFRHLPRAVQAHLMERATPAIRQLYDAELSLGETIGAHH
jgi:RimJ/RimL family protein N-acetyltransferase